MANFDDLQGAVAQFGANNKVIFDDTGMPSIMVAVPKAKYSDVITAEQMKHYHFGLWTERKRA